VKSAKFRISRICISVSTLYCQVDGNPKPTVSWRRSDDPEVLSINRQLKISPVSRYDAGTYVCSAVNSVASGTDQQWNIDVQCKFHLRTSGIFLQRARSFGRFPAKNRLFRVILKNVKHIVIANNEETNTGK